MLLSTPPIEMIVPDANLLFYAYDTSAPLHRLARRWWEGALSAHEPVGLPWVVVLAFVRLITHPTLSEHPFTVPAAEAAVRQWLDCDHVQFLHARETTLERFFSLLDSPGCGGSIPSKPNAPERCRPDAISPPGAPRRAGYASALLCYHSRFRLPPSSRAGIVG